MLWKFQLIKKIISFPKNYNVLAILLSSIILCWCLETNNHKNFKEEKSSNNKINNNLSFNEIKILIETWEYSKAIDNLLKIKDNLLSERNSVEKKQD